MAASNEKATPKKTTTVEKKVAASKSTTKKVSAKVSTPKVAVKPKTTTNKTTKISAEQHYKMVEIAAYYIAEKNGFAASPSGYWAEAEAQINSMLSK